MALSFLSKYQSVMAYLKGKGKNFSDLFSTKYEAVFFPVVLFIILYKTALTFEAVDEILKCCYSNESY